MTRLLRFRYSNLKRSVVSTDLSVEILLVARSLTCISGYLTWNADVLASKLPRSIDSDRILSGMSYSFLVKAFKLNHESFEARHRFRSWHSLLGLLLVYEVVCCQLKTDSYHSLLNPFLPINPPVHRFSGRILLTNSSWDMTADRPVQRLVSPRVRHSTDSLCRRPCWWLGERFWFRPRRLE